MTKVRTRGVWSVLFLALGAVQGHPAIGEEIPDGAATIDPHLNAKEDAYLNRQAEALLKQARDVFDRFPPRYPEPLERRLALLLMDGVLHDVYAASRPPVQQFFHDQMERATQELESTHVRRGARIWKLYNMGFIVRTATVTIGFDLIRCASDRAPGFAIPQATMERLVRQCDVLFISHRHQDHADEVVAQAFLELGKPVVAPPQVWSDRPIFARITHLERSTELVQPLAVQGGKQTLQVVCYPGHQGRGIENNVSLVITPEKLSFCHIGDQINEGDFMEDYAWIDQVGRQHRVDVFLPNCWTNELYRIVQGFNPALVLPGHENELGHPIDDRVPYWGDADFLQLTNPQLLKSRYPVVVMTWGESIQYPLKGGKAVKTRGASK